MTSSSSGSKTSPFFKLAELSPSPKNEINAVKLGPKVFGDFMVGYRATKAIMVASNLGLFFQLDLSDGTVSDISLRLKCSERHIGILLEALSTLGIIEKSGSVYRNTSLSREWLHPDGIHSLSNNYRYQEYLSPAYARLSQTIREGSPAQSLGELIKQNPCFLDAYMRGMEEIARAVAGHLDEIIGPKDIRSVLDVGAGHGLFSISMIEKYPNSVATMVDFREPLNYARRNAKHLLTTGRVRFMEGDYHAIKFGESEFDIALLSHVVHDESPAENISIFKKIHTALAPNGLLYVHDFMTSVIGHSSTFSSLFSLHLASYTISGRVYPESEILRWLEDVGFVFEAGWHVPSELHPGTKILVAKKEHNS